MVRDGIPFVLVPLLIFIVLLIFKFWLLAVPFLLLTAFMAYFFRDPEREIPGDPDVIVSPADGRVTRVEKLDTVDGASMLVSIFLSPFDVHINRSPISGKVSRVAYTKGKFMMATREDASLLNEQNILEIKNEQITLICKQIAGILARRIVCWKREGDTVKRGERFGLIKFSSRTDLIIPEEVQIEVREGDKVKGGTTIIGRIKNV